MSCHSYKRLLTDQQQRLLKESTTEIPIFPMRTWFAAAGFTCLQVEIVVFVSHCSMVDPPQAVCTRPMGGAAPAGKVALSSCAK